MTAKRYSKVQALIAVCALCATLAANVAWGDYSMEVPVSVDAMGLFFCGEGFLIVDDSWNLEVDNFGVLSILEFNVGSNFTELEIASARLEFDVYSYDSFSVSYPNPHVYAYEGDGSIQPSDAYKTTNLAGVSTGISNLGIHAIDLDPAVLKAQLGLEPWLGMVLTESDQLVSFEALESSYGTPPTLILQVVPEPAVLVMLIGSSVAVLFIRRRRL